ncbi:monoacylglycerol lipase ABHD2-like [Acanthaster planci]|uniref:Monoacylglycerol lipase ABHD2-like n=1 Tax=Acanthaster planci TaxID=133434 RepID=A0A8B7ZKZ5_ACAPL|nr:monoacylglycerol lipase ABHD2-like [Acanthaster planci]
MEAWVIVSVAVLVYVIAVKFLGLTEKTEPPSLLHANSKFVHRILQACPILTEPYVPTFLWGRSGHLQTTIYAKIGRFSAPWPTGERCTHVMPDGATFTFDIFEPTASHSTGGDFTMCVVPGIANNSEKAYVRTFIAFAQSQGFRLAVLNHLGSLPTVPLTSPRIFTYGDTDEYSVLVDHVRERFPSSHLISIGFSMGANIIVKYLGERPKRQDWFLCGLSICQGYDITKATYVLHEWENCRRLYNFMMAQNMLSEIRRNSGMLFGEQAKAYWRDRESDPIAYNIDQIMNSTSLVHLDEHLTHKMVRSNSCEDFYKECSSSVHIDKVHIPLLLLNAADDHLIPVRHNDTPVRYAQRAPNAIYCLTKHGGHLGFFEGGFLVPNTVSWMDKAVVGYTNAIIELKEVCLET